MDDLLNYQLEAEYLIESIKEYRVEFWLLVFSFMIPFASVSPVAVIISLVCYLSCFFYHPIKDRIKGNV